MAIRVSWKNAEGKYISYLKTYEDASRAMGLVYNDVVKDFFKKMEQYGHNEKSICYATYKVGTEIIKYIMNRVSNKEFTGTGKYNIYKLTKYDEDLFKTIRGYLKEYSWEKDDARWIAYCERRKVEEENDIKIKKAMENDDKLVADYNAGKYPGAKIENRKENGLYRKVLVQYYIYFIQGENGGAIKIGLSNNPKSRLKQLQTGYPDTLKILLIILGDEKVERQLHEELKLSKLHGEWFKPDENVIDKIKELAQLGGV